MRVRTGSWSSTKKTARALRLTAVFVLAGAAVAVGAGRAEGASPAKFGVGFVPYTEGGDASEQLLFKAMGELPQVDRVYGADDSLHLFRTLLKLRDSGRKIDYLVIAGHGSGETPGVKFAKDDMIPEEVSLAWNRNYLTSAVAALKNPGDSKHAQYLKKEIADTRLRIAFLESISDVMAKDAVVVLINCSAARTNKGKEFVRDFGDVLLGRRGGHIIASERDIVLKEYTSLVDAVFRQYYPETGQPEPGELHISGAQWVSFPVKASKTGPTPIPQQTAPAKTTTTPTANTPTQVTVTIGSATCTWTWATGKTTCSGVDKATRVIYVRNGTKLNATASTNVPLPKGWRVTATGGIPKTTCEATAGAKSCSITVGGTPEIENRNSDVTAQIFLADASGKYVGWQGVVIYLGVGQCGGCPTK
jgi:hypothetical protein